MGTPRPTAKLKDLVLSMISSRIQILAYIVIAFSDCLRYTYTILISNNLDILKHHKPLGEVGFGSERECLTRKQYIVVQSGQSNHY